MGSVNTSKGRVFFQESQFPGCCGIVVVHGLTLNDDNDDINEWVGKMLEGTEKDKAVLKEYCKELFDKLMDYAYNFDGTHNILMADVMLSNDLLHTLDEYGDSEEYKVYSLSFTLLYKMGMDMELLQEELFNNNTDRLLAVYSHTIDR